MGNDASSDNGGGNDSSSSNDNNSKYHSDNNCSSRCVWTSNIGGYAIKDNGDRILCIRVFPNYSSDSSSSSSSNRSSNSTSNSVDREGVNDDRNSNSYSSGSSNYDVIGNNVALKDIVKYLKIISPDKKHSMNCKKITSDEYTKLKEKLLNDGWSVIGFAKFHELMYYLEFLYQYKLTETTYIDYENYIYLMNLLKSDNNTSTHSVAKTITQTPIVKQTTIQTPVVKTSPSVVKTTIQTPVVKTSTLSFPKKKESIDKYTKISNDLYSQYNAGKITASEYLKVQNNVSEVYEKNGHLISTSVQFSNQVYLKISEDASKQYKAGKLKPGEYAKICNDARTKYYTEPVSTRQNSIPTRVENGYVMSAQARVNAVNQVASVENSSLPGLDSVLEGLSNPDTYVPGASVIRAVAETISNGLVNPSANSERTNQVLNMVSNVPTAVDLLTSTPTGIVSTIANGALGEVNNSLNERSTTRNMINGIAGATALIATRVAPRVAPGIGNAITAIETLELINNLHVERVRNSTPGQLEEMVLERNRIAMNGVM